MISLVLHALSLEGIDILYVIIILINSLWVSLNSDPIIHIYFVCGSSDPCDPATPGPIFDSSLMDQQWTEIINQDIEFLSNPHQ